MSESALVRIFRPTAGIGYSSSYRILIDGTEKGDLWPRQATEVSVRPGQHVIQLRQGLVTRQKHLSSRRSLEKSSTLPVHLSRPCSVSPACIEPRRMKRRRLRPSVRQPLCPDK